MKLQTLREEVLAANLELVRRGLVLYTFGNASGIARDESLVVIKPSGVPYEKMKPEDLVVTDIDGKIIEGTLRPSSDLPTHLILYRAFPGIPPCHSMGASAKGDSLSGNDPGRLFSRTCSVDEAAYAKGN